MSSLTSDDMDIGGVKLIRKMFKDNQTRAGQTVLALCNALEREIRRNAHLKEVIEGYKPLRYDGHEKGKHDSAD